MANKNPTKIHGQLEFNPTYSGDIFYPTAHLVDVQLGSTRMPGLGILMVFYGFATIKMIILIVQMSCMFILCGDMIQVV